MNAVTSSFVDIGAISDIPPRGARTLVVGEKKIAVFRDQANQIYALEDSCPHKQGPLSQGIVHDDCVTCPLHNWVISLKTGKAQGADEGQTRTYSIKIDGNRVLIDLSDL